MNIKYIVHKENLYKILFSYFRQFSINQIPNLKTEKFLKTLKSKKHDLLDWQLIAYCILRKKQSLQYAYGNIGKNISLVWWTPSCDPTYSNWKLKTISWTMKFHHIKIRHSKSLIEALEQHFRCSKFKLQLFVICNTLYTLSEI